MSQENMTITESAENSEICPAQKLLKSLSGKLKPEIFSLAIKSTLRFSSLLRDIKGANKQSLSIAAAKLSKSEDLIGNSYVIKGAVYYFNYRKFQPALDEYLKAYDHTKNAKDQYLKYENLYHIGVVKSYLGYYQEALSIFQQCLDYFEPNTRANIHPNLIFNNQKGYLNTLHQIIVCHQSLGKDKHVQKLINEALNKTPKNKDFYLEKSYFEKAKGISNFHQKKYSIEDIAESCGFSNRQSFSNIFYEQNGIRPQDFLKIRREELNIR